MSNLIPGEALIYERANGILYAKYRDVPHNKIPRWIVGGDPNSIAKAQGKLLTHQSWNELVELAQKNPTLKKQLDKTLDLYYIIKDDR